jgi:hypothetical protein
MTTDLEWNVRQRVQQDAERQQQRVQQDRQAAQRRDALRAELPYWRRLRAAIEPALAAAREEAERLDAAEQAAVARWVRAYHRDSGGDTPRQGTGELVLLTPMEGMNPLDLAAIPARAEHAALTKAQAAAQEAHTAVRQLEADERALDHNIGVCEQA